MRQHPIAPTRLTDDLGWSRRGRRALRGACLAVLALLGGAGCASGSGGVIAAGGACGPAPGTAAVSALPPRLEAVSAAPGTRQAWAVGERFVAAGPNVDYLLHFSGLTWSTAVTFRPGIALNGVSAASGSAAWVWGYDVPGKSIASERPFQALVSGGAVHQVRTASLSSVDVWAMASDGAADTWLTGGARDQRGRFIGAVAARWNGTSWQREPAPARLSQATSLSTSGPSDTWAAAKGTGARQWLVRWNGAAWSTAYTPPASLSRAESLPGGMSVATSPGHAWVVYNEEVLMDPESGRPIPPRPVSAYFDGGTWRVAAVPRAFASLTDVTMSGTDAWAIGDASSPRLLHSHQGSGWCVQSLPRPLHAACSPRQIVGVSSASPTYVIAVTASTPVGSRCSVAYVYDGHRWRPV